MKVDDDEGSDLGELLRRCAAISTVDELSSEHARLQARMPRLSSRDKKRAINNVRKQLNAFLSAHQPSPVRLPTSSAVPRLTTSERWKWWSSIGAPKYVCAPMVLQSELSFRMLVRQHGCTLCYTPMIPVAAYLASDTDGGPNPLTGGPNTQSSWFTTNPLDRPLVAQLGGNDAEALCTVALKLQPFVDAIDLNLGCPQRCAEQGGYGAFLMEDAALVQHLVETLVARLAIPVTVKIRIWADLERTVAFAKMLEDAGAAAVCVHGRRREQRHHEGPADWDAVKAVKAALSIPVISNGSVRRKAEADACLAYTGCDAVMSATALLANPHLFSSAQERSGRDGCGCLVRDGKPTGVGRLRMANEYAPALAICRMHAYYSSICHV